MTQELLERTVRDWVMGDPARGARELDRLADSSPFHAAQTAEVWRTIPDMVRAAWVRGRRLEGPATSHGSLPGL